MLKVKEVVIDYKTLIGVLLGIFEGHLKHSAFPIFLTI